MTDVIEPLTRTRDGRLTVSNLDAYYGIALRPVPVCPSCQTPVVHDLSRATVISCPGCQAPLKVIAPERPGEPVLLARPWFRDMDLMRDLVNAEAAAGALGLTPPDCDYLTTRRRTRPTTVLVPRTAWALLAAAAAFAAIII